MNIAFKEWSVVCRALADGTQSLILRKGGIEEIGGEFQVEHTRFWLFPTYLHQNRESIKSEHSPLLESVHAGRPPGDVIRLTHFVEVAGVYRVEDLPAVLLLNHLHIWSEAAVRARFNYRQPGLFVLPVRVYHAAKAFDLPNSAYYEGCRSWVELESDLATEGGVPVLEQTDFGELRDQVDRLLVPARP